MEKSKYLPGRMAEYLSDRIPKDFQKIGQRE